MVLKKKIETCTLKLNIRENRILLSTGGGATCRQYAFFVHVLLFFIKKFLCVMLLMELIGTNSFQNQLKYK